MTANFTGVEKETRAFLEKLQIDSGTPIYKLSPDEAREVLSNLQSGQTTKPLAEIQDLTISTKSFDRIPIRIIRPMNSRDRILPVVIYTHGGGWVLGGIDTHDRLVRELANSVNAAIVFVNYSRSPEAKYPIALEEIYETLTWVSENSHSYNMDADRIAVVGDSVGGNMATAVTMLAKSRNGPKILFQVLFYPVTNRNFETESYHAFQEGYFLTREAMKWFWDNYISSEADLTNPTVCPVIATKDQLNGLPPALIITGEFDVLRDEGEEYAHKLMESGVVVTACRYHGTIHDFVMLNVVAETPAARGAIAQASNELRKILWNNHK